MAKLVDANEIFVLFYERVDHGENLLDAFEDALEDATSVDAVEVVRCKDCAFLDSECCPMNGNPWDVMLDDFCSYGEKLACDCSRM